MDGFQFDSKDFEKKIKKMSSDKIKTLSKEIENAIEKGARRVEADAVKNIVNNGTKDTGSLEEGIEAEKVSGDGVNVVWHVTAKAPHSKAVEYGTRPHTPPLQPLVEWARRKLGVEDAEAVGKAIQDKISEQGTRAQPFMRPAYFSNEEKIKSDIQKAILKGLLK